MMLAALYDLDGAQNQVRQNLWRPPQLKASQLRGKTVGLIGLGKIGRETARLLAPWGAAMQYSARRDGDLTGLPPMRRVDLDTLLRTSDVVLVMASLNPETRGLVGAEKLKLMKPNAILVNTARGAIVDEAALAMALKSRAIAGAALDCFAVEPLSADSPLRGLPNAILTPHMIGHTVEAHHSLEVATRENLELILSGKPPRYVVNPAVLPAWMAKWGRP
jgi:D-3-phosphoglycerate dehydrogenase